MDTNTRKNLQKQIDNATTKIKNLKSEKKIYTNMKNKIKNEVLPKLKSAKNSINEAKTNLKNNYSSTESTKKTNNLQTYVGKVTNIINNLNQSILPGIEKKINAINQEISNKERSKQKTIDKLKQG